MFDKFELESDPVDKSNHTEMLNKTVKSVIDRKLPDRIYMSLARKDIDTIYKLKQASMELGLYDAIPENHRSNRTEMNKRRNRETIIKIIIKNITIIEITTTVIIILARIRIIIHNHLKIRLNL